MNGREGRGGRSGEEVVNDHMLMHILNKRHKKTKIPNSSDQLVDGREGRGRGGGSGEEGVNDHILIRILNKRHKKD